jgi:hypothetical protein
MMHLKMSPPLKRPKRTESRPLPQINYNSLVKEVDVGVLPNPSNSTVKYSALEACLVTRDGYLKNKPLL